MSTDEHVPPPSESDEPPLEGSNVRPLRPHTNGTGPRVPPHSLEAERAVISACLYASAATVDNAAHLAPADFYRPAHGHIWSAILDLREHGVAADAPLVADRPGVDRELVTELADNQLAYASNVAVYADTVATMAHRRRILGVAAALADAAYDGAPVDVGAVAEKLTFRCATESKEPLVSDLQAVMDGDVDPIIPDVAPRDDHATCLLYAPGINWLSGEPGEGKSMLALWWVAQVLRDGHHALYLDYEGTAQGCVARLAEMGVKDVTRLAYIRMVDKWDAARLAELRELVKTTPFRIAVIDAVAGAMEAEELDPESNKDVEKWCAFMPAFLSAGGAAVVCVDHVAKNKEGRGRWMIGAQRKMARADAAFNLEMFEKAGVGVTGHGKLLVAKDRYGALAPHQAGRMICEVAIVSEEDDDGTHDLSVVLASPGLAVTPGGTQSGPTWYMEEVSRLLEAGEPMGVRDIRKAVGRKARYVDEAIKQLTELGHIESTPGLRNARPFVSVHPYRQPLSPITVDAAPLEVAAAQSFYETGDELF